MVMRDSLDTACGLVRAKLRGAYRQLVLEESAASEIPDFGGQLLRPLLALAGADDSKQLDERFWFAALAVQLAHEASLVHDDVLDNASRRRGSPTVCATSGVAAAVIEGDMLLTAAYSAAAATRSEHFVSAFARAVARTVAAERLQGSLLGTRVGPAMSEQIALGKAGELLGCAVAAAALVSGSRDADVHTALGREIGLLYQMMDDLLDYCIEHDGGKPTLGDYAQGRWTWPLDELSDPRLGLDPGSLMNALHSRLDTAGGPSPLQRAACSLQSRIASVTRRSSAMFPDDPLLPPLLDRWRATVETAVERERVVRAANVRRELCARLHGALAQPGGETRYLARHSRSFRFASRLLPHGHRQRIARVYAFCRFTDDLADEPDNGVAGRAELLDEWLTLSSASYHGAPTGLALLDTTMAEMRVGEVPFDHVTELCAGMRMDLDGTRYQSLEDLRVYTHRVAGTVGLWIAQLAGVRDQCALAHAERLGHAMQLTNILRDVGEDWRRGRLYLPRDVLARHGLSADDIGDMVTGQRQLCASYMAAMDELLHLAQAEYRATFAWLPIMPSALQPGLAIAARVYEGILSSLRRNAYDNIGKRAGTSIVRKIGIAVRAMHALGRARRAGMPARADASLDASLTTSLMNG